MDSSRITQQTSTTLPLRGELTHDAPAPRALWRGTFEGPLQWALEGPGWRIVRPVGRLRAAVRGRRRRPRRGGRDPARLIGSRSPARAAAAGHAALLPARPVPHPPARARARRDRARPQRRVRRGDGRGDARDALQRAAARPGRLAARLAVRAARRGRRARRPVVRPALGAQAPPRGQVGPDHGRRRRRRAGGAAPGDPSRVRARARSASSTRTRARSPRSAGATSPCWARSRISTRPSSTRASGT